MAQKGRAATDNGGNEAQATAKPEKHLFCLSILMVYFAQNNSKTQFQSDFVSNFGQILHKLPPALHTHIQIHTYRQNGKEKGQTHVL